MEREISGEPTPTGERPQSQVEKETKIGATPEEKEKDLQGLKRGAQDELRAFTQLETGQVTPEKTVKLLSAHEAYLRKEVSREQEEARKNPLARPGDVDYRAEWQESMDALRGATGKGPVSETVRFLKVGAARYKSEADTIREKFLGGRLIENRPLAVAEAFQNIADQSQQAIQWERAANNLETAARLFENLENLSSFKVSEEPQP